MSDSAPFAPARPLLDCVVWLQPDAVARSGRVLSWSATLHHAYDSLPAGMDEGRFWPCGRGLLLDTLGSGVHTRADTMRETLAGAAREAASSVYMHGGQWRGCRVLHGVREVVRGGVRHLVAVSL